MQTFGCEYVDLHGTMNKKLRRDILRAVGILGAIVVVMALLSLIA